MRRSNWRILERNDRFLIIEDLGPWNIYWSVTNDAEAVVLELAPELDGRRLLYRDSQGQLDEILIKDGQFAGFVPGPK